MSRRQVTPEEKAKQDAARKGIAALRRLSGITSYSAEERKARAHKAVIAYMTEKGLLPSWPEGYSQTRIEVDYCDLEWNPDAPTRAYQVRMVVKQEGTWQHTGRKRRWIDAYWDTVATVAVPHWDYDGVDPLVAREPYDRQVAENWLDRQAKSRNACGVWSNYDVDHDIREYEACEHLNADHAGIAGAATFTYATGPEG